MDNIKHKGQRVGILIDTQNLYHGAKNLYGAKVNFQNIITDALAGRDLIRAIAYVINTDSVEEKTFFDALGKMGIEAKIKDIQVFSSGSKKADWDVGLAIDAVRLAPKLDVIVIASGDGDFKDLVEYLQGTFGCRVEVLAFGKSASHLIKDKVDAFIDLSENPNRYLISQNNRMHSRSSSPRMSRPPAQPHANTTTSRKTKIVRTNINSHE